MPIYEIWTEGYSTMGQYSPAIFHDAIMADSFKEAVEKWVDKDPSRKEFYNSRDLTFWGCKIFDNETEARERFG